MVDQWKLKKKHIFNFSINIGFEVCKNIGFDIFYVYYFIPRAFIRLDES
jgi:hypothetical protein